ncbi:hypothetical protein JCM9957A_48440 [Kineosporia succinea]
MADDGRRAREQAGASGQACEQAGASGQACEQAGASGQACEQADAGEQTRASRREPADERGARWLRSGG